MCLCVLSHRFDRHHLTDEYVSLGFAIKGKEGHKTLNDGTTDTAGDVNAIDTYVSITRKSIGA